MSNIVIKIGTTKEDPLKKYLIIGGGLFVYFSMSILTVYLYSKYSLVLIQSSLALTFIVSPILAKFILKEKLPRRTWTSIFIIFIGIVIISLGSR